LEIRRGVCQFYEIPPEERDATVIFDRAFLLKWIFGKTTFDEAVAAGDITIDGEAATVADFLAKFEPFNQTEEIAIAAR
jgi:alkyl sulfatase BDS1-like metallo-beta-lactamase superfamily hydrolase